MSEAAAVAAPQQAPQPVLGVTNGKFGMWIFLGSDGMSFMGLIATYVALRIGNWDNWPVVSETLNIPVTALNTFILICSSVTMVKAYEGAVDGDVAKLKKYLIFTIMGGICFLGIQVYEYNELIFHRHLTLSGLYPLDPVTGVASEQPVPGTQLFGATFFSLTCFHGCHVFSGVVYLSLTLISVMRNRWTTNRIEILGLYWHFVDLLWIVIFAIIYLVEKSY